MFSSEAFECTDVISANKIFCAADTYKNKPIFSSTNKREYSLYTRTVRIHVYYALRGLETYKQYCHVCIYVVSTKGYMQPALIKKYFHYVLESIKNIRNSCSTNYCQYLCKSRIRKNTC